MIKHPSIGRIKQCALLSCQVDYTPNNNYISNFKFTLLKPNNSKETSEVNLNI